MDEPWNRCTRGQSCTTYAGNECIADKNFSTLGSERQLLWFYILYDRHYRNLHLKMEYMFKACLSLSKSSMKIIVTHNNWRTWNRFCISWFSKFSASSISFGQQHKYLTDNLGAYKWIYSLRVHPFVPFHPRLKQDRQGHLDPSKKARLRTNSSVRNKEH